ncbi:hypothetical protein MOVS_03495 [Moraxella ovis]|uniref:WG repeat-containing protein n=1 Tax=Moraxella ovis TaxID=29433 RepID=A0ABN4PP05_9GAMM|nr:WG repeat-containing protein [Moraxella ovis]ANB91202.1 hypothetical protein MOVS_03495 [Moraxella ovis]
MAGYDYVRCLKDGLAIAKKNNKYGYVDKTGKTAISFQCNYSWGFKNGKALVELNGQYFHIDKTGKRLD